MMDKKIWLAALAALATGGVHAADVQINGAVDTFVAVNHTESIGYASAISSGGVNATHFGIKGSEDIAPGLQAFFALDSAVYSDTGTFATGSGANGLFNREANVGLRGAFGSISFGRQYTPHFLTFLFYDPTGLSIGSSYSGNFMAGPASTCGDQGELVRHDNSVSYVLPTSFGLTNFLYAALGETTKSNGSTSSTTGNIYNYAAKYDNGPFSAMASYLWQKNVSLASISKQGIAGAENYKVQYFNFSMSYDFGVTKPVVQFEKKWVSSEGKNQWTDASGEKRGSDEFWLAQIGTSTPVFGGLWMVSASYLKNQTRDDADSWGVGTKFNYPLSKRTRLYAGIQAIFNEDKAGYQVEAGPDSSLHFNFDNSNMITGNGFGVPDSCLGKNVQTFFMGISHEF